MPVRRPGTEIGFWTVYLDNYLFITIDGQIAADFNARLIRNCHHFNLVLKEGSHVLLSPDDIARGKLEYLGIEIRLLRNWCRTDPSALRMRWRIAPDKISVLPRKIDWEKATARQSASAMGKVIYRELLNVDILGMSAAALVLMPIYSAVCKQPRSQAIGTRLLF